MHRHHEEAAEYIRARTLHNFEIGIILGTGLGGLVKYIEKDFHIEYSEIPNFPVSTVESHTGRLIFGTLSGKKIIAMQGRFHFYEGYSHQRVTFPIHIMKHLGTRVIIASNACGALNPKFKKTDLMIMKSHINLHFNTPLISANFKPVNSTVHYYSKNLINVAEKTAVENGIPFQKGVYASVPGPALETKAEYRAIRKFGADVVGMSTVPEILVAHKLGMETMGVSIITDEGFPDTVKVAKIEHILEAASIAEPKMTLLIKKLVETI
ncbi:purine-nucleoside phosphorylase [bacterium]|nr:MAG: purine-nucleoside phosphorylase [bacterium]